MKSILTAAALAFAATTAWASPEIVAHVDISTQKMVVEVDGKELHTWDVSTARPGKITPTGEWGVQWLSARHKSSLYNNAPMPWAIFFNGHYAIHGTDQVSRLGQPASAGCVRLHPDNAEVLFKMVKAAGKQSLRVVVQQ